MASIGYCPTLKEPDDSPLSKTSNILGIFTFVFAFSIGAWIRVWKWSAANKEFLEFEKYVQVHKLEFEWMRILLKKGKDSSFLPRPEMPHEQSSRGDGQLPTSRPSFTPQRETRIVVATNPTPGGRLRRAGQYFMRQHRTKRAKEYEDRVRQNKVIQAFRHTMIDKKRRESKKCREKEDKWFDEILIKLKELDRKLQKKVNQVREVEPSLVELVKDEYIAGSTRTSPTISRHGTGRNSHATRPDHAQGNTENGSLLATRTPTATVHQINRNGSHTAQNGTASPLRTSMSTATSVVMPPPTATTTGSQQTSAPTQHSLESGVRTKRRGYFDRIAGCFLRKWPDSWISSWIISMNWLRVREEALKLQKDRDIQWDRIHASQLALISRRFDDQDDYFEMLLTKCWTAT